MTASINNYTVGKGIVSFRKDGAGAYADMGNCTEFEFTPELEKLDGNPPVFGGGLEVEFSRYLERGDSDEEGQIYGSADRRDSERG